MFLFKVIRRLDLGSFSGLDLESLGGLNLRSLLNLKYLGGHFRLLSQAADFSRAVSLPSGLVKSPSTREFVAEFVEMTMEQYSVLHTGQLYTKSYRAYLLDSQRNPISFFHDLPLKTNKEGVYNFVVEIPRWSNAKLEISKKEPFNPIVQDESKGQVRFVKNCFPFKGYVWNYGAIPQTWESPLERDEIAGEYGDNDPLDALEIGSAVGYTGEVKQVKILGAIALIDGGETDWKIFVIDINDPKADSVSCIADIEIHFPGLLNATREWFRVYKIPDGKPENRFSCETNYDKDVALKIIDKCHKMWKDLMLKGGGEDHQISLANATVSEGKFVVPDSSEVKMKISSLSPTTLPPALVDKSLDTWYYVLKK